VAVRENRFQKKKAAFRLHLFLAGCVDLAVVVEHASAVCFFAVSSSCVINFRLESVIIPSWFSSEVVVRTACTMTTTSLLGGDWAVCVMKLTCAGASSSSRLHRLDGFDGVVAWLLPSDSCVQIVAPPRICCLAQVFRCLMQGSRQIYIDASS